MKPPSRRPASNQYVVQDLQVSRPKDGAAPFKRVARAGGRPLGKQWRWHDAQEICDRLQQVQRLSETGTPLVQAFAASGIAVSTFFRWRKLYSGMNIEQIAYVKKLESEVTHLQRRLAEIEGA